ncbi:MAG: carboxypeptidase regulatory-like domain-containing protein [Terriglobia bacterium]
MKEVTRRSFSTLLSSVFLLLGMLLPMRPAYAQFTSGFVGTAVDQSGAAIPNAKVVVTNQATNVATETVTSSSGDFRIASLLGGTYRVQVDAPGFQPWIQSDLVLEFNQVKTLYPILSVNKQTTTVEVKATVAAVTVAKSDTSREIDQVTIDNAPLLGRNVYTSIVELGPGLTGSGALYGNAAGSGSANNDSFEQEPAYQINAAGQRQESNEYQVDGTSENSASRDGVVNLTPEPDFVEAIRVAGANFSAAKGRYSGALVQVYTKPGTNALHGSLSEFFSDNDLTGRTIFQTCPPGATDCHAVPVFQRHEFGGSVGGPIIKNKLFVYGGLFVLRSSNPQTQEATVETPQFDAWVAQNLPNNISNTFFTKAPPGVAPVTGFLTVSQLETQFPGEFPAPANLPGDLVAEGTGFFPQSSRHDGYQWHVRSDYNFNNDKDRLFFDWFDTWDNEAELDPHPVYRYTTPNHGVMAKLDWTHTFSPTVLNEASVTVGNADGFQPGSQQPELPNVNISGVSGYSQWGPAGWVHDNYNWHDILTWTHGKHTIETGIDVDRHHDLDHFTIPQIRPSFSFANLIDFAQDRPYAQSGPTEDVATGALANDLYERIDWLYWGAFVQDDYKVTPRFTLNLGARFEYYGHWGNYHNSDTPFPMFSTGSGSTFAEEIANGSMSVRGSAHDAYVAENKPHGISPRIGFGWDVFGNGKTALRGGYGLFYNNVADGSYSFAVRGSPPFWADPTFDIHSAPNQPFSYALGTGSAENIQFPVPPGLTYKINSAGGIAGFPVETYGVNPTVDQPRTHNWMFAIQHDFGHNLAAEADYNGSHSEHLFVQTDVNRFPGDLVQNDGVQTRLNPNFGPIIYGQTVGTADGHYGTLMLTKRFSQSWQLRGIFTFGKATDELSSNDNGTANSESVFNPLDLSTQHGLSDYDVARRFTVDSVWEIPTPFTAGLAKAVLGGWRMSHIMILQSGLPFTVYTSAPFEAVYNQSGTAVIGNTGGDYNADGYGYDTPNTPSFGNHISTNRRSFINGFAQASAFPVPALGQAGNLGRNTFSGPGMANINSEFTKAFKIPWFTAEGASFEIRADIFNLFNRVNLTPPTSDLSSSLFGLSTGQNLPRSAQLGVHIAF